MTQTLQIHPKDPQVRLLNQSVDILKSGGVIVYPTDSGYALGCCIGNRDGALRIRQIRNLGKGHNFTLICHDLSELAIYAKVDNSVFRFLKAHTPGPYTFILPATKEAPKRLIHEKRKTVGIRIPENKIALNLLEILSEPMMSVSFLFPEGQEDIPNENRISELGTNRSEKLGITAKREGSVDQLHDRPDRRSQQSGKPKCEGYIALLDGRVDLIIDGGFCGNEPTTMIDFTTNPDGIPKIIRQGSGIIHF